MSICKKGRDLMAIFMELRHKTQPCDLYLARANRHLIGKMNVKSAKLGMFLNDIWELDVEMDKYLDINKINPYYPNVSQYKEVFITDVGWFRLNGQPIETEEYSSGRIYKRFTAYGCETQLQDINLSTFYVNNGLPISIEMYEENLDALGLPKHNVQFWIDDASDDPTSSQYWGLGLINYIEHEHLSRKGWTIDHVDTELKSLRGRRFEIDNQDVYSFFMQDMAKAYRCLPIFDRIHKTISFYKVENLGKSLNIEMSRRNLLDSVTITAQNDYSYTKFRVAGGSDETTISYVNFGEESITNLDYFIEDQFSESTYLKYKFYTDYRESKRDEYANTIKDWLKTQQEIDVIHQQIPIDEVKTNWNALETDELNQQLKQFQALLAALELAHTIDGSLQIEGTPDYATYMSIKESVIPDIESVLKDREEGKEPDPDKDASYITDWSLYGIDELEIKKKNYENQVDLLKKQGYDHPWVDGEDTTNKTTHNEHYQQYLKYQKYVDEIALRIKTLEDRENDLKELQKSLAAKRDQISTDVKITNAKYNFTQAELDDIESLIVETDYTDHTIEYQSMDDIDDIIELSKELLKSAQDQLEKESRPQLKYKIEADNPYKISQYKKAMNHLEMGDFIYMELDRGGRKVAKNIVSDESGNVTVDEHNEEIQTTVEKPSYKIQQRVIGITLELVDFSDNDITIEFSDMTLFRGKAADYDYLLDSGKSSSRNSISKDISTYGTGIMTGIAKDVLNNYLSGGGSMFPSGIGGEDLQKLMDALSGLIDGNLTLDELKVKLAQIDSLEANSAFIQYLNSQYLVADQADFKELRAKLAMIDDLLAGTVSADLGHLIHLTAENVNIDEAVIKEIIAARILVSDLKAGDITLTDKMRILSENGQMIMNGETLQIMGKDSNGNDYVAIQLGYDAKSNPSLIIRNNNNAIMLDADGLHEDAVPDGLIKNDMISDKTIGRDKLAFNAVETDESGRITNVADVLVDGESMKAKFATIEEDIQNGIPYVIALSNEHQSFAVDTNRKPISDYTFTTDITVYKGTSEIEFIIGTINSANGITVVSSGQTVTFKVTKSTPILSDNGYFTIPINVGGETYTKKFTWSISKQGENGGKGEKGNDGTNGSDAKAIVVTSTSQVFKSTDGGMTFSPNTITLTPTFQGGLKYSKWQYSGNGGSTWITITSGQDGFTISNGILTVSKDSSVYSNAITAVSFKCLSDDTNYFDIVTVVRLSDTSESETWGINLVRNSNTISFSDYYFCSILADESGADIIDENGNQILTMLS